MVRSQTVLVSGIISPRKVFWWWVLGGEWQTKFNVSPGPVWSLVLGPYGPDDLGPDLDLTWDLDLSLTISKIDTVELTF